MVRTSSTTPLAFTPFDDPREEANRLNTLYPDAPPAFLVPPATVELLHDDQEVTHGSHT